MRFRERSLWISLLTLSILGNVFFVALPVRADLSEYHKYQDIFQNVYHYVTTMYVDEIPPRRLLIGAIRGLLSATGDPYTRFLDREEHEEFNSAEGGQKVGIGVEITLRNGMPLVIAPIEGGPADRAGIHAGDLIVTINGKSTRNRQFGEILKMISGKIGTALELEVVREGVEKPLPIQVTRGLFNLEYLKTAYLKNNTIGYLHLLQFFGKKTGVVERFRSALVDFKTKNVRGIIIDLRNNTGGHLDMAQTLTGYFLKPGEVIVTARGRDKKGIRVLRAGVDAGLIPPRIPIVVLINHGSASASEIMAGALQDHNRAVLVGSRSFGKASVQQIVRPLPDDTAALITIQRYYTPNNRSIHGKGLKPDIIIAEPKPSIEERYFLDMLDKDGYFQKLKDKHPRYEPEVLELFRDEMKKRGWSFNRIHMIRILRARYGVAPVSGPDLEIDLQLNRAIEAITSGRARAG